MICLGRNFFILQLEEPQKSERFLDDKVGSVILLRNIDGRKVEFRQPWHFLESSYPPLIPKDLEEHKK